MAKLSDNRAEIEADVLLEMKKQETLESDINQEMQIAEEKIIQLKNERQRGPGNEISNGRGLKGKAQRFRTKIYDGRNESF